MNCILIVSLACAVIATIVVAVFFYREVKILKKTFIVKICDPDANRASLSIENLVSKTIHLSVE